MNKQILILCLLVIRTKVPSRWVCSEFRNFRFRKRHDRSWDESQNSSHEICRNTGLVYSSDEEVIDLSKVIFAGKWADHGGLWTTYMCDDLQVIQPLDHTDRVMWHHFIQFFQFREWDHHNPSCLGELGKCETLRLSIRGLVTFPYAEGAYWDRHFYHPFQALNSWNWMFYIARKDVPGTLQRLPITRYE